MSMLFLFVWSKRVWNNSMLPLTLAAVVPNLMNLLSCYIANVFTSPSFSTRRSNSSDKEEDLADTPGVTNLQKAMMAHCTIDFLPLKKDFI